MAVTKVATCCYCGTKAALVLRGKMRHELSCSNCGAPLHVMKILPMAPASVATPARSEVKRDPRRPSTKSTDKREKYRAKPNKPGKRRKSKGFGRKVWEDVWDVLEDVLDDVFD